MVNPSKAIPIRDDLRWLISVVVNHIEGLTDKNLGKMLTSTGEFRIHFNQPLIGHIKRLLVGSIWSKATVAEHGNYNSVFSCMLRQGNPQWKSGNFSFLPVGKPVADYELQVFVQV